VEFARKVLVKPVQFMNTVLSRNGCIGRSACEIMAAALNAVDPYQIIREQVRISEKTLIIQDEVIPLGEIDRVFIAGFGKASVPMSQALLDEFEGEVTLAEVVTKDNKFLDEAGYRGKLKVHLGGHPIPTRASLTATRAVLDSLGQLTSNDLVLLAISGGGSALFSHPFPEIALDDMKKMTDGLLRSGADIQEINTLRKHLDQVKGGRLATRLQPARVHALILSDVIGDRLDMIASGPTAPDPTTYSDAIQIIERYHLRTTMPGSILQLVDKGQAGDLEETPKESDFQKMWVKNHLLGTNIKAAQAANQKAEALGFNSLILTTHLVGQTRHVAEVLSAIIQTELDHQQPAERPCCLILGGETTVHVQGNGKGGRNQDLALHMVKKLADQQGALFIALATDGEDGPTDAAGAACDGKVYRDSTERLGLDLDTYIDTNNAYNYFDTMGGLIKIGSTGTNVNDLILILINR